MLRDVEVVQVQSPASVGQGSHDVLECEPSTLTACSDESYQEAGASAFGRLYSVLLGGIYARILLKDDTPKEQFFKQWALLVGLLEIALGLAACCAFVGYISVMLWTTVVWIALLVNGAAILMYLLIARRFGKTEMTVMCFSFLITVLLPMELNAIVHQSAHWWPCFVILLDQSLVFELDAWVHYTLIIVGLVWIACISAARVWDVTGFVDPLVNTTAPTEGDPCRNTPSHGGMAMETVAQAAIFLTDYLITRSFAGSVRREKQGVQAAVDTAEDIANYLSVFDLDAAAATLEKVGGGSPGATPPRVHANPLTPYPNADNTAPPAPHTECPKLPPRLRSAFVKILRNLETYRCYLPRSCLPLHTLAEVDKTGCVASGSAEDPSSSPDPSPISSTVPVSPPSALVLLERRGSHHTLASMSALTHTSAPSEVSQGSDEEEAPRSPTRSPRGPLASSGSKVNLKLLRRTARSHLRPRTTQGTLLHTNLHRTNEWCHDVPHVESTFREVMGYAVDVFSSSGGILDLFLGDRVMVSFNTSRPLVRHPTRALSAAKRFFTAIGCGTTSRLNIAVGTGSVVCGDLGCDTMRRYTILGHLPLQVWGLERMGRALRVDIACNHLTYGHSFCDHELKRVHRNVVFMRPAFEDALESASLNNTLTMLPGAGDEAMSCERATQGSSVTPPMLGTESSLSTRPTFGEEFGVYDVVVYREDLSGSSLENALNPVTPNRPTDDDWMYSLDRSAPLQWAHYNRAMHLMLEGMAPGMCLEAMRGKPHEEAFKFALNNFSTVAFEQHV